MAELKLDYYRGEDLYSDGEVENELLAIAKSGVRPEEQEHADFPVLYHFAKVRENILNWYPFEEGAACLEIGSGCGAVTGLLCRRMAHVTSVELSRRRAEINFTRHREYENLELWVGNLNDMHFAGKFDYVILNGVFEYAVSFTPGDDPCGTFLRKIRDFLKPEGVILVAIENRLGLKYFAGAPEDHMDGYFDGIRGYENGGGACTFSRGEWETLMRRCGLEHYKFYYPYPDYKFPQEIFTDLSLKEQKYGRPSWNFTKYRMALFEETKLAATLSAEGVMAQFANSFLIEMSAAPLRGGHDVQYVKLSTDRADAYAVATVIEKRQEGRVVVKRPMTGAARAHIQRMLAQMDGDYGLWHPLRGTAEGDGIVYPFLEQKSLAQLAAIAVQRRDLEEVKRLVRQAEELYAGGGDTTSARMCRFCEMTGEARAEFRKVFGPGEIAGDALCVAPANIDLILDNLFGTEEGYLAIDCEWIFDFPVPVRFLLWRAVNELYSSHPALAQLCPKQAFLEEFGVSGEEDRIFWEWSTHFAEAYVGANRMLRFSRPEIGISIEEFRQRLREREAMISQLFIDTGNGYSEEQKLVKETELSEGAFSLTFDLKQFSGVRSVRFDPLEGRPCVCRIDAARTTAKLRADNAAAATPEGDLFLTTDPIYQVKLKPGADRITIAGEIRVLSMEEALERSTALLGKAYRRGRGLNVWHRLRAERGLTGKTPAGPGGNT